MSRRPRRSTLPAPTPNQFAAVEIRDGGTYRTVANDELNTLVASIEEERSTKLHVFIGPDGMDFVRLKEGFTESWLLDGLRTGKSKL